MASASWIKTPVDIFPNIGIPVVAVVWTYGGESPEDMSERIIYYYERTLSSQVNDIEHIESQSLPNYGIVKIFFQPGVNINGALAQVTAASQTVLKYLPAGITPPYVLSFNASSVPVLQLALSSQSLDQARIFDKGQNFIRPQLASVAGAAIPSPYGGKVLQVQVDLDQNKLQAYGLSAQDVVNTIAQQNIVTPVGDAVIGKFEYVVNLNGSPDKIEELNNIPLKVVNGATVFLRDVAFAHAGAPPQINMVRVDGNNAVLMTILKAGSVSTLDVINGVKKLLPRLKETLPESLKLDAVGDQSAFVKQSVNSVIREGIIAAALTGLMILIFLGSWRSTLIITTSIPLAILSAVALLAAIGQTINVMTLGGLALAVGILVDDATVTIENINWHLEQDKDIETAIMDGARQIVIPATVSLLCILHRVRADVQPRRRRRLSVPSDGGGGRVRAHLVLRDLAHAGLDHGALSARRPGAPSSRHGDAAADPQSARHVPARVRASVRGDALLLSAAARHGARRDDICSSPASCWSSSVRSAWRRSWARTSFPPSKAPSSSCMSARRRVRASRRRPRSAIASKRRSATASRRAP